MKSIIVISGLFLCVSAIAGEDPILRKHGWPNQGERDAPYVISGRRPKVIWGIPAAHCSFSEGNRRLNVVLLQSVVVGEMTFSVLAQVDTLDSSGRLIRFFNTLLYRDVTIANQGKTYSIQGEDIALSIDATRESRGNISTRGAIKGVGDEGHPFEVDDFECTIFGRQ